MRGSVAASAGAPSALFGAGGWVYSIYLLRRLDELPPSTDQLFVVDRDVANPKPVGSTAHLSLARTGVSIVPSS